MSHPLQSSEMRLHAYLERNEATMSCVLGFGVHGDVFVIERDFSRRISHSALKIHNSPEAYLSERDIYMRLFDRDVFEVLGHAVPQLLNIDDDLLAIEMTIVTRPFVLGFGGAYLDRKPDYDEETMAECLREKEEQFGDNWEHASAILAALRRYGIYVADVNPGNIGFVNAENSRSGASS